MSDDDDYIETCEWGPVGHVTQLTEDKPKRKVKKWPLGFIWPDNFKEPTED